MPRTPKLKIRPVFNSDAEADVCDLEQAKNRLTYGHESIVLVEGQAVNSHEELVRLASQNQGKDKEFLEVVILPNIVGGG